MEIFLIITQCTWWTIHSTILIQDNTQIIILILFLQATITPTAVLQIQLAILILIVFLLIISLILTCFHPITLDILLNIIHLLHSTQSKNLSKTFNMVIRQKKYLITIRINNNNNNKFTLLLITKYSSILNCKKSKIIIIRLPWNIKRTTHRRESCKDNNLISPWDSNNNNLHFKMAVVERITYHTILPISYISQMNWKITN